MVRTPFALLGGIAVAALLLATPRAASAQPQNLTVDCAAGQSINTALTQITDRSANNTITISGTCTTGAAVTLAGFNRLTFEGTAGATIKRTWQFVNSTNILVKSLTFDLDQAGPGLVLNQSRVTLEGTTIQEACCDAAVDLVNSTLAGSVTTPSTITANFGHGVRVGAGSLLRAANMTISNNSRGGIHANDGGAVALVGRVFVPGTGFVATPVDISGNGNEGIEMEGGSLNAEAEAPSGLIRIHDNGATGVSIGAGFANLRGTSRLTTTALATSATWKWVWPSEDWGWDRALKSRARLWPSPAG
jgi:hypothetical protein